MRAPIALGLALLAACSDAPEKPPVDDVPMGTGELQPLDVGRTWTYVGMLGERQVRRIVGREALGRLDCVVYEIATGADVQKLWVRAEKDGLKHYRVQNGVHAAEDLDDPVVHYVIPATPGAKWQYEMGGAFPVQFDASIAGIETVEVPAGRFKCVKVRSVGSAEKVRIVERTAWYAPGIGLVKEEWILNMKDGVERGSIALKEHTK